MHVRAYSPLRKREPNSKNFMEHQGIDPGIQSAQSQLIGKTRVKINCASMLLLTGLDISICIIEKVLLNWNHYCTKKFRAKGTKEIQQVLKNSTANLHASDLLLISFVSSNGLQDIHLACMRIHISCQVPDESFLQSLVLHTIEILAIRNIKLPTYLIVRRSMVCRVHGAW